MRAPPKIQCRCSRAVPSEPVENSDNSELRSISCFLSHSGHRAVVHRSRSETCRARLKPRSFVPKAKRPKQARYLAPAENGRASFSSCTVMAVTVRIIFILAAAIAIGPSLAHSSPACMTQSEAQTHCPKAVHLYRHKGCWSGSAVAPVHSQRPAVAAAPAHLPRPAADPAPSPPPAVAAAHVPSPRPKIVSGSTDAGAQCQYSPCE